MFRFIGTNLSWSGSSDRLDQEVKKRAPGGCPRKVDDVDVLGVVLFWYGTCSSSARTVSLAFGLTAAPMCEWINFGQRTLFHTL